MIWFVNEQAKLVIIGRWKVKTLQNFRCIWEVLFESSCTISFRSLKTRLLQISSNFLHATFIEIFSCAQPSRGDTNNNTVEKTAKIPCKHQWLGTFPSKIVARSRNSNENVVRHKKLNMLENLLIAPLRKLHIWRINCCVHAAKQNV